MQIVILGASGMLGSMVLDWFSRDSALQLTATVRAANLIPSMQRCIPGVDYKPLDAASCNLQDIQDAMAGAQRVVNAIGVIKPYIHDDNAAEIERALRVNALFPHLLALAAQAQGAQVLQIATDCVYSGKSGHYDESAVHDPLDVYGKTKSLGEVFSPRMNHLRCSIIGPEPKGHVSLLDWFRGQALNASVNGYTNHQWNGVTTLHFAQVCHGIIKHGLSLPHVQHLVPDGTESKADMLSCFARNYRREDIAIAPIEAKTVIDRTLATRDDALNRQLWQAAGYRQPPTVPQMIAEMAQFDYRLNGISL